MLKAKSMHQLPGVQKQCSCRAHSKTSSSKKHAINFKQEEMDGAKLRWNTHEKNINFLREFDKRMLTLNVKQIIGLRRCQWKWYIEMGNTSSRSCNRERPQETTESQTICFAKTLFAICFFDVLYRSLWFRNKTDEEKKIESASEMWGKSCTKLYDVRIILFVVVKMSSIERDSRGRIMVLFSCRPSRTLYTNASKYLRWMESKEEASEIYTVISTRNPEMDQNLRDWTMAKSANKQTESIRMNESVWQWGLKSFACVHNMKVVCCVCVLGCLWVKMCLIFDDFKCVQHGITMR